MCQRPRLLQALISPYDKSLIQTGLVPKSLSASRLVSSELTASQLIASTYQEWSELSKYSHRLERKITSTNRDLSAFCFPDIRSSYAILLALRDAGLNV